MMHGRKNIKLHRKEFVHHVGHLPRSNTNVNTNTNTKPCYRKETFLYIMHPFVLYKHNGSFSVLAQFIIQALATSGISML